MKDAQFLQKKYMPPTYINRQITLIKGEGVFLFDENGTSHLDLMSNYGVNVFGYNHPVITGALTKQLQTLTTLHGSFINDVRSQAAEQLVKRSGSAYSQVFWSNSGAEAMEAALKFAVAATGKKRFIVCNNAYHGKTLGALSATADKKYRGPFEPLLWEFVHIPFNDVGALEKAIDKNTSGFIVEPIQGEGGISVPDKNYLRSVRNICDKQNVLLILDEIQTGNGRTGLFLSSQRENISADILCLGKGLGGGIPIGATLLTEKVAHMLPRHIHSSTFGGNPLACDGVLATLQLLDQERLNYISDVGDYFKEQLSLLNSKLILDVRGMGLMLGLVIKDQRTEVLKLLQREHILAIPSGEDIVRFLPPYIIERKHIDDAIIVLQKIFKELS